MQLEQMMGYQPRATQERQATYFVVGNLENLSASALYMADKDSGKEYRKYVDETIREDDHAPLGEHLNYEVWLNLKGLKEGRNVNLSNTHIPLQSGS